MSRGPVSMVVALLAIGCGKSDRVEPPPAPTPAGDPAAAAAVKTEATGCPIEKRPLRRPAPGRLIALGDLHGDLAATRSALVAGGAINEAGAWVGGELVVVQTGDILDRGDDEVEIYAFFDALTAEARRAGGDIVLLNGNHEFMNAAGDLRYVTRGGFEDFASGSLAASGVKRRQRDFAPGGDFARRLAAFDVVAMVGDSVFVHGGVEPSHARADVATLNREARCWLAGHGDLPDGLSVDHGPVWSRRFSLDPADCDALAESLAALGAARMVVGHTPQMKGITSACEERVWRIDVGLSRHYGGPIEVLEIGPDGPRVLRGKRAPATR